MRRRKSTDVSGSWIIILLGLFVIIKILTTYPWILTIGFIGLFIFLMGFWIYKVRENKFKAYDLSEIDRMNPFKFEEYICKIYQQLGYNAKCTPKGKDYGADVLIQNGGYKAAIQVKRYNIKHATGIKAVQEVIAALPYYNVQNGIVITTSYFTQAAKNLAESADIELIDRDKLKEILYYLDKNKGRDS